MAIVTKHTYDAGLDAMRVIAILAVMLIHTSTRFLETSHFDLRNNLFFLWENQISRFAVPLFFLISGFVLELSYKDLSSYISKRVSRIVMPYLFWSIIYYFFIYTNHVDNFWQALLSGSASYQLYFIPSLIILYAFFPVIHRLGKKLINIWVLTALLGIQLWLLNLDYFYLNLNLYYPVAIAVLNFWIFLAGIFAYRNLAILKRYLGIGALILIIPAFYLAKYVFNEGLNYYYQTYNIHYIYSQWRPSVLAYTICVAVLLYSFFTYVKLPIKPIKFLSGLSFFVFFVHTWILEIAWKFGIRSGLFIIVTIVSFVLAYLVHLVRKAELITG